MPDKHYPFAQWWVLAVGRPPLAEESALYVKVEELFEYAKQIAEEKSSLQQALDASIAIADIQRKRLTELGAEIE